MSINGLLGRLASALEIFGLSASGKSGTTAPADKRLLKELCVSVNVREARVVFIIPLADMRLWVFVPGPCSTMLGIDCIEGQSHPIIFTERSSSDLMKTVVLLSEAYATSV